MRECVSDNCGRSAAGDPHTREAELSRRDLRDRRAGVPEEEPQGEREAARRCASSVSSPHRSLVVRLLRFLFIYLKQYVKK